MAKQTVLMDGKIPIYHLYYTNANLEPGSVMTTFPYAEGPDGRDPGKSTRPLLGFRGLAVILEGSPEAARL